MPSTKLNPADRATTAPKAEPTSPKTRIEPVSPRAQLPLTIGFVALVLVALTTVWVVVSSHRFASSVERTLQTRSEAYRLLSFVQDAETGQRGFLLTQDRTYLAPYLVGSRQAPASLERLAGLVGGRAEQQATLGRLHRLIDAKLAELASTLVPADKGDFAEALRIVKTNAGNKDMANIRSEVDRFDKEEVRAQNSLRAGADFNNDLLAAVSLGGVALIVALATYTLAQSRRATTALIGAQRELQHSNDNLEAIVAERVAELQLANEEVQRFAYIVSHDLRAPLVNVMGFTSELDAAREAISGFLDDVEKSAPQLLTEDRRLAIRTDLPEALGFIRTSTAKMDRLINAILKLSREGRRVLTPQPIALRDLVEAQGRSLSQQLAAGDAKLTVQDDLPDLTSDRLAVEQIFGNLIENATKYLFPGRPGHIEVSGKTHGAYLRYEVKDNGRGIEAKDFERIFELFRRSGEQDKPGEGIGLAYVRNLARRLGGNVSVQSEYGRGSVFTVTLPQKFEVKARAAR